MPSSYLDVTSIHIPPHIDYFTDSYISNEEMKRTNISKLFIRDSVKPVHTYLVAAILFFVSFADHRHCHRRPRMSRRLLDAGFTHAYYFASLGFIFLPNCRSIHDRGAHAPSLSPVTAPPTTTRASMGNPCMLLSYSINCPSPVPSSRVSASAVPDCHCLPRFLRNVHPTSALGCKSSATGPLVCLWSTGIAGNPPNDA